MGTFVNAPAVDYFSVTTYDGVIFTRFTELLESFVDTPAKDSKIQQYTGLWRENNTVFHGVGLQAEKPHFMIKTSQGSAQNLYDLTLERLSLLQHLFNCTRIDLQITLPLWDNHNFAEFCNVVKDAEKNNDIGVGTFRGRRARWRGFRAQLNSDGMDTLYIGSRATGRYIRIYVKEIDDVMYLRFEVEYGQQLARTVGRRLMKGNTTIADTLLGELVALPPIFDDLLPFRWFMESLGVADKPQYKKSDTTMERRWNWFVNQVIPSIDEMLQDKDFGSQMENALRSILKSQYK